MSADLSKAYELLGVKPGVSIRELKAAYRDLTKVWHPDRFGHDPRLQEKAQEKLKEINEAYEQLSLRKVPRFVATTSPRPASTPKARSGFPRVMVALLMFVAVFSVTIGALLQRRTQPVQEVAAQSEEPESPVLDISEQPDPGSRRDVARQASQEETKPEATPLTITTEPTPAVATVTVMVDPESGLLATEHCKLRSRVTYPSGNEPTAYCKLSHLPPPKDSPVKSFAKRLLGGKNQPQVNADR